MAQSASEWLLYAILSGLCAALNGAFAKLTTTRTTSTYANYIAENNVYGEVMVRGVFLTMNIVFNGVMWTLFTKALKASDSTVRVSVINTSANFVATALLGAVVFGEELKGLWWLGAAMLVAGSVIIGRRDSDENSDVDGKSDATIADDGKSSDVQSTLAKGAARSRRGRK